MTAATLPEGIAAALEGLSFAPVEDRDGLPSIRVERGQLHETLERLRDRAGCASVTFITAVDHDTREPRFDVVHQLLAIPSGLRVRVTTQVSEDDASVPTCVDLWPGAAFSERECWDMFGIRFEGHENLRRLLMPEGYGHHPLRKDFPQEGIEPDRLYREWDAKRRAGWSEQP
jgi:NADH-quinone oxidoreductase subunit C